MNSSPALPWSQQGDALLLRVFVQPRASRNQFCGIHEGELKLRLTSPPVDGAANECCREFLAKQLKVPKSAVTLISGDSSRHKRLRIAGATTQQIEQLIPPA
ncbi:DUF167 domain-containing protein [Trichlorobacter lovleyi]|uniref:UPF0235 protein Glov_0413 n=1 Tax=Trichlorobacter lovleyi (strain ATCC BAA-1151 / DSM 17278 / SZ) TaxID=398767 RepID=B3E1P9_TRIL1|nr:DUF167 family protein [Trichlorobacter lovleyi]ACD94141.1 protein of unknown function DUF167 [Trichlorobacter lovleyi SZ]